MSDITLYKNQSDIDLQNEELLRQNLLDDDTIAESINFIATSATKELTTRYDTITVPDYKTRLKALELIMKWKWYLNNNQKKSWFDSLPAGIYILKKEEEQ